MIWTSSVLRITRPVDAVLTVTYPYPPSDHASRVDARTVTRSLTMDIP